MRTLLFGLKLNICFLLTLTFMQSDQLSAGLKFDGRAGEVRIPDLRYRAKTPLTIEVVLTPQVSRDRQSRVLSNINSVGGKTEGFSLSVSNGFWLVAVQTERGLRRLISDDPYVNGARVHLAIVFHENRVKLFVNGRENDSNLKLTHPIIPSDTDFLIGCQRNDAGRIGYRFFGEIDAVQFSSAKKYERSFTPAEQMLPDKDTMLLYDFAEEPKGHCRDLSGLGLNGVVSDVTWVESSSSRAYTDISQLQKVVGIHEVQRKIKGGVSLKPVFYELTADYEVLQKKTKIGSWTIGESKEIELTLDGDQLGPVVLKIDADGRLRGLQERDSRVIEWELNPIRVEMVWNHLRLAENRILGSREYEFYSNGKFGAYDHHWEWEQKGSSLTLQWESDNVSQLKLSRDKQTYTGFSGKGDLLGGVRLD